MQVIKLYRDTLEAGVAQGVLQDHDIESFVSDEALAGIDPRLVAANGGVRLMVDDEDFESASAILCDFYDEQGDPEDESEEISVSLEIAKFSLKFLGLAMLGAFVGTGVIIVLINFLKDK